MDGKLKPVRDPSCTTDAHRRAHGAVQGCAPDAGAADAGGDENKWQTCATVVQAAALVRAAMGCTAVANCRCECTGRCRTVCTGRCTTDGKLKPVRDSHCVVGLHRRVQGAVQKDAHQIRAAVGAPAGARVVRTAAVCLDAELGDGRCPDGGLLCDDVAAMLCTAAGHGWSLSASCCTRAWARARRLVAAEVMELWRRSGDGLALGTHAPLATERRTLYSGLSVGREEAQRIVSGISPASRLRGNFASCRPKSTAAIQRPPSHRFNVVLIQEESGP
jgi:hypothetical protein